MPSRPHTPSRPWSPAGRFSGNVGGPAANSKLVSHLARRKHKVRAGGSGSPRRAFSSFQTLRVAGGWRESDPGVHGTPAGGSFWRRGRGVLL